MCTAYLYNWSQASTCQRLLEHFFHIAQRWSTARAGHSGLMTHLVGLFTRRATVPPGQQGNASAATGSGITLCIAPTHWVDEQRGGRRLAVDIGAGSNPLCGCGHNRRTSMAPLRASGEQGKAELLPGKASNGAAFPKHSTGRISSQVC